MFQFFKKLFAPTVPINYKELVKDGAIVIDVRTPSEYKSGHIKSSKNIPLQELSKKLNSLNKHKTYILCCATGNRSGSAKKLMVSAGFEFVHNGGGWIQLQGKII